MKKVFILRGESGTGKAELGQALAGDNCFAADDMPGLYEDGKYQLEKQKDAHVWCLEQFKNAIAQGSDPIVVANTNIKIGYMKSYIDGYQALNPLRRVFLLLM